MRYTRFLTVALVMLAAACSSGSLTVEEYAEKHCLKEPTPEEKMKNSAPELAEYHDALVSLLEARLYEAQGQNPFERVGEGGTADPGALAWTLESVPDDVYDVLAANGCAGP